MSTFSSVYPFNVTLENHSFGNDVSLLYITNKIDETSAFQKLKVSVLQQALGEYTFNGFGFTAPTSMTNYVPATTINEPTLAPVNSAFKPDVSQYNLGVVVKQGVLEKQVLLSFSNILYEAIHASLPKGAACAVQGPFVSSNDNTLTWYCAFSQSIGSSTWKPVPNTIPMVNISKTADGKLLGIGTDQKYYTCDLKKGPTWILEGGTGDAWQTPSAVALPNGQIRFVGYENTLGDGGTVVCDEGQKIPNCGSTAFIAGMVDNSLLGLNTAGDLLHMSVEATSWQTIDKTTPMKSISVDINNTIYGIGTDTSIYERRGIQGTWRKIAVLPESVVYQQTVGAEQYGVNCVNNTLVYSSLKNTTPVLCFELDGVSAAPESGSRNTQIEFLFGNISIGVDSEKFAFKRLLSLDIINHQGQCYAPMHFGMVGENTLLNNGSPQDVSLYFQTHQNQAITFNENTRIRFNFAYSEPDSGLVTFASSSELSAYTFASNNDGFTAQSNTNGVIELSYKESATPASNPKSMGIFNFSDVALSGSNGLVIVEVSVENLPGYWDSTFQIAINKAAFSTPDQLELPKSNNNGRSGSNGARIDFTTEGKDQNQHYNVSIEADNGLNLYGTLPNTASNGARGVNTSALEQKTGFPIRVKETDLLIPDGRLAINGGGNYPATENANEKLNVYGDTLLRGKVKVCGSSLRIDGPSAASDFALSIGETGAVQVDGPGQHAGRLNLTSAGDLGIGQESPQSKLDVNGRIRDQTGMVMPVGSVIAYGGESAPEGWLMCDGKIIPSGDQYSELINTLQVGNTPNLCGRTIIGTGTRYPMNTDGSQPNLTELVNASLGVMGGNTLHQLTCDEMPTHAHNYMVQATKAGQGEWPSTTDRHPSKSIETTTQTGGNKPHNNIQPYIALNYIIKY